MAVEQLNFAVTGMNSQLNFIAEVIATGPPGPQGSSSANLVTSVNGKQGTVVVTAGDVGLGNVDNTSDVNKPVSTATSTALALKAPLASPGLTGIPTAPTATAGTNSIQLATTAYVDAAAALVEASDVDSFNGRIGTVLPVTGDYTAAQVTNAADKSSGTTQTFTGNLAAPNLSGTNTGDQNLTPYALLASPSFTGTPTVPTASGSTNTTQVASTAFVQAAITAAASTYDDVKDYANLAAFPVTGTVDVLYMANDTNFVYRWGGSTYIQVGGGTSADATTTTKGIVQLAGDLAGTAASPTVPTKVSKAGDTMTGTLNTQLVKSYNGTFQTDSTTDGMYLKAEAQSSTAELRITGNVNAWSDNQNVAYFQARFKGNQNMMFIGGTAGADVNLTRTLFNTAYFQISSSNYDTLTPPTAQLDVDASTSSVASIRVRTGVAPTTPNSGDIWQDGTHLYGYIGGATRQLDQQSTGGGGSGITRSIILFSSTTTAASTALTDYIYIGTGTNTLTLPTAASNTNAYGVKNNGTGVISVATTASQTIDGNTSLQLSPGQFVTLYSTNTNWIIGA